MIKISGKVTIRAVIIIAVLTSIIFISVSNSDKGVSRVLAANSDTVSIESEQVSEVRVSPQEYYDTVLVSNMLENKINWPTDRVDSNIWANNDKTYVLAQPNLNEMTVPLTRIEAEQENFLGTVIVLSDEDRELIEKIVQQESGGIDVLAAALVAQCIRDTYITKNYSSFRELFSAMGYTNITNKTPNENTEEAVRFIFDRGGMAVKHRMIYFYAPKKVNSSFHESQEFVIEYGGHRYFDAN